MNEIVIAPTSVDVTGDGGIDMADLSVIDHVDASGMLRWIAGRSGLCGFSGDAGPATQATLCQAHDATRDGHGNLFIADTNNNRIRRVDAQSGVITTVAGSGAVNGNEGYNHGTSCGDGSPATVACLNTPYGVAFDSVGNMFISEGSKIRRVDAAGTISTFVDGLHVTKLIVDANDLLYAGRFTTLERYDRSGARTILAGSEGQNGFSGDGGPALNAKVGIASQASGIAIDREGNLFFVDGHRLRAVRYGAVLAPAGATISAMKNGSTIRATVLDSSGRPAPGVRIDFAAPSSGASCALSSPFAITDSKGEAIVTCTSNCLPGTYSVIAQPLTTLSTANISFVNASVPCRPHGLRH